MTLDLARLLIDFGFTILIWAVQLVIYPSFGYYSEKNLFKWHKLYTVRITFIVLPLMFSQLILCCLQLWYTQSLYTLLSIIIVALLWFLTFLIFVPLHQSIDNKTPKAKVCNTLVKTNWIRTALWTILFMLSIITYCF